MIARIWIGMGVLMALLAWGCFYVMPVTQRAVVLQFGEIASSERIQPGLNFKIPIIQEVIRFNAKLQTIDGDPHTYLTKENEVLEVDSFVKWRVADELAFYRATGGDVRRVMRLIMDRVDAALRNEFGSRSKTEVVTEERDDMLDNVLFTVRSAVSDELGVHILDVRINRIELPATARESVYRRMVAERQRLANEARAEGKEISETIRSEAERARTVLLSEATRDAEVLRGEGDAEAARIYAEAFGKDPGLFDLVRSLNAYRTTFAGKDDVMVLSPDGEFFKYLESDVGAGGTGSP